MQLQLYENGIDSLKSGLKFYGQYLKLGGYDEKSYGVLKLTVISLHNAVEILSKKILTDINELLIYKDMSDFLLQRLKVKTRSGGRSLPLDYYLTNFDEDIITIDYQVTVHRLRLLFDLGERDCRILLEIGKLRNKITHFAIDKLIEFHQILGAINRTLQFFVDFVFLILPEEKKKITPLKRKIESLLVLGTDMEEDVWGAFYYHNFVEINEMFGELCSELNLHYGHERFEFHYINDTPHRCPQIILFDSR